MKIAHISDLHLSTLFSENNLENIELSLKYLDDVNIDHLAITGDLTDNADPKDFILLRDLFLKYNFLDSKRLSVVIGNHDIFGGVQRAEDIFIFPEKCKTVDYYQKVNEFYNYFSDTFKGCCYISPNSIFPFSKVIDDVLIIGLNSIAEYSRVKNPFASNGNIDLQQIFELTEILENHKTAKNKIVLVHHYFNKLKVKPHKFSNSFWFNIEKQTMRLRKKKRLLNIFNQYDIRLVLHGHYHFSNEYRRRGIRFSNAGASFKGYVSNEININMITISNEKIDIEIQKLRNISRTLKPVFIDEPVQDNLGLKIAAAVSF